MFFQINLGSWVFQRLRLLLTSCGAILCSFYFLFVVVLMSPASSSVVQENSAALLCCEAPENLC